MADQRVIAGVQQRCGLSAAGLQRRGILDGDGAFTDAGRVLRASIERRTDELALAPYESLGPDDCARLEKALDVVGRLTGDAASITYPNPMGLTANGEDRAAY